MIAAILAHVQQEIGKLRYVAQQHSIQHIVLRLNSLAQTVAFKGKQLLLFSQPTLLVRISLTLTLSPFSNKTSIGPLDFAPKAPTPGVFTITS